MSGRREMAANLDNRRGLSGFETRRKVRKAGWGRPFEVWSRVLRIRPAALLAPCSGLLSPPALNAGIYLAPVQETPSQLVVGGAIGGMRTTRSPFLLRRFGEPGSRAGPFLALLLAHRS